MTVYYALKLSDGTLATNDGKVIVGPREGWGPFFDPPPLGGSMVPFDIGDVPIIQAQDCVHVHRVTAKGAEAAAKVLLSESAVLFGVTEGKP